MNQDRESLRDLDGVRISIDDLPPTAVSRGLSADALRRLVEAALKRAHIPVLTSGDFPVGDPFLRVHVDVSPEQSGLAAWQVALEFVQMAFIRRNPAVTFNRAVTWRAQESIALAPAERIKALVERELSRQVDAFLGAYAAVNGR